MMNTKQLLVIFFMMALSMHGFTQNDTLIIEGHTVLVGGIKEIDQGVVTMKTSYSDKDFKIKYLKVKAIISERTFNFTLNDGRRFFGSISIDSISNQLRIFDRKKGFVIVNPNELVYLKQIDEGNIFDILNLSLDIGYSFTKSNNLHQFNSSINGDYNRRVWGIAGNINTVQNFQDKVDPTRRTTAEIGFKLFHKRDYFTSINANYLSNNEQQIDLRSSYDMNYGKYLVHTNKVYFNAAIGLAYTLENYSDTIFDRHSFEGKIKLEYNMFNMGDLNMYTSIAVLPSLTEKGRVRANIKFNVKYDLPRDFYIKTSYDNNYDNKPVEGSSVDDYVITFGVGWEL